MYHDSRFYASILVVILVVANALSTNTMRLHHFSCSNTKAVPLWGKDTTYPRERKVTITRARNHNECSLKSRGSRPSSSRGNRACVGRCRH